MTTSGAGDDPAATEAARWLLLLEDNPENSDLRARFDAWLMASPANAKAWANTSDVYGMMIKAQPAHRKHWAPYASARRSAPPRAHATATSQSLRLLAQHALFSRRRLMISLASAAVAACLAFIFVPGLLVHMQADLVTSTAEVQSFDLEDGSTVQLGPDSAVQLAYSKGERRTHLLKGEAFFKVRPDPDWPFRVVAGDVEATVLGTSFNVRFEGDGAEVAVRTGLVRVSYPAGRPAVAERLGPGEWAHIGKAGRVERGAVAPGEVASWLNGQIVARNRPMTDVIEEIRRYYSGRIVLLDGALGARRVTGVYNPSDPVAALRAVVGTHEGRVREISPWLLVVSGG